MIRDYYYDDYDISRCSEENHFEAVGFRIITIIIIISSSSSTTIIIVTYLLTYLLGLALHLVMMM